MIAQPVPSRFGSFLISGFRDEDWGECGAGKGVDGACPRGRWRPLAGTAGALGGAEGVPPGQ